MVYDAHLVHWYANRKKNLRKKSFLCKLDDEMYNPWQYEDVETMWFS
jgi:hypothetical protein